MVLKVHKIEVDKAIKGANLNSKDFIIKEENVALQLIPNGSNFYFNLFHSKENYHTFGCTFTHFAPIATPHTLSKNDWDIHDLIRLYLVPWLNNSAKVYFENLQAPDPWHNLHLNYDPVIFNAEHKLHSKDKFTERDIAAIQPALDVLEEKIESIQVSGEIETQLKQIKEDLREIREDLKTLTKKKWSWQFIGLGFQILTFAQKFAPEVFEDLKETINSLFSEFSRRLIS